MNNSCHCCHTQQLWSNDSNEFWTFWTSCFIIFHPSIHSLLSLMVSSMVQDKFSGFISSKSFTCLLIEDLIFSNITKHNKATCVVIDFVLLNPNTGHIHLEALWTASIALTLFICFLFFCFCCSVIFFWFLFVLFLSFHPSIDLCWSPSHHFMEANDEGQMRCLE